MGYRHRLTRDLDRWIAAGLIETDNRDAILDTVGPRIGGATALGALTVLGAVLLGLSALSFVGANWEAIPRLARFGVLLAALWASLLGSGLAFQRQAPRLGHALAVLGLALFGAAILLTAQTFNMTAFRNTAVLIWAVAGGGLAWQLGSRPVLILATGLGALWAGLEAANPFVDGAIWLYLPVATASAVLATRLRSTASMHLVALALVLLIAHALYLWQAAHPTGHLALQSAATLVFGTVALAAASLRDRKLAGAGVIAGWMTVVTLLAAFLVQIPLGGHAADRELVTGAYAMIAAPAMIAIALLILWRRLTGALRNWDAASLVAVGLAIAALPLIAEAADGSILLRMGVGALLYAAFTALILIGERHNSLMARVCGVSGFVLQTLYIYAQTFEGLLDTALFFFVGGLILFAASFALWRLRRGKADATGGDA
ncbi:DUF2157 domain-containing protein [Maricaulis maris]|uniref:Putative membrane protein n=1 Tax=Maricaulis maris TaxID=74318 RepID=A0A495DCL7_9PROT|nr:DUF2157 domain-containing protein [Maricaulis maris]RKR00003.1 putative membrane protein [Maricaulis maris]